MSTATTSTTRDERVHFIIADLRTGQPAMPFSIAAIAAYCEDTPLTNDELAAMRSCSPGDVVKIELDGDVTPLKCVQVTS